MIKVSVLYPYTANARFDMDYYLNHHVPMVREKLGSACQGAIIEQGVSGGAPGSPPPYLVIGHLMFDSVASFQSAFGPHASAIMADIPNYTPIQPVLQISEVKLS